VQLAKKTKTARGVAVPVVATIAMAAFSYKLENITDWRLTIFGLMTLFVVYYLQDGIVGFCRTCSGAAAKHVPVAQQIAGAGRAVITPAARMRRNPAEGDQILMQFGGLKALNRWT
jgi:branched-chain amino acid transport system permease protein